ncbi:MAG: sporulation transcription factor Spo0A [Clostridia bacterium]|nr:sporulation transcription factor Spo0A [Clostridia bacterium]
MIKKIKVLVLDDSELQRAKIQDLFLNNEEFELIGCLNDGLEGINIVRDEQPDVVIADIVLQNYDGFELLEKIKEMNFVSKPKILILSSLKGDDFAQKALDLGASYYMVKPVAEEILLKRIKSLVDSNANGDTQIIRNGRNRALEEKISNVFITVGIPAHIKGYQFLREAIKMAIRQPEIINSITKQLYPAIANLFSTSASKVERAIRHAIEVAWNRGKIENINALFGIKVYNTNEKPTNGEFIALVADKMLIEGA